MKRTVLTVAFLVFLSAFVVIITVLPEARASTIYVGGGGPGNYTTIQSAIDAAVPGDRIFVFNGTYNENLVVDRTLSLVGESRDWDSTSINGGGFGDTIHVTADWVNLTGFFVWNGGLNGWDAGIELDQVQNCFISGNNFFVNDFDGIFLRSSSSNTIANNTVVFNRNSGIYLLSSHNNTIIDNNVSSNGFNIVLDSSNGNIIVNNNASDSDSGISLFYSDGNTIIDNNASNNSNHGINLEYSHNNGIESNTASNNGNDGIHIYFSDSNNLSNNAASNNENDSIHLDHSSNNTVDGNTVMDSNVGISTRSSTGNVIVNNMAVDNGVGVHIFFSDHNILAGNTMVGDGIFMWGNMLEMWNTHVIDTSNTVNGQPVYYWKNVTGGMIPSGAGQVILANSTGVMVDHQDLSNGTTGIILGFSSGNNVNNNTICSNNRDGFLSSSSNNNTIDDNTVCLNLRGIRLTSSDGNVVTSNIVSDNQDNLWGGILVVQSNENVIEENIVSRNGNGIALSDSDNNAFANNTVRSSNGTGPLGGTGFIIFPRCDNNTIVDNIVFDNIRGIVIQYLTDNNLIHHNDFVANADSVDGGPGNNQWDDGYPSGGNYWSDYNGVDSFSGPDQDQPGSDGIGDTSYDVGWGNEDRYPLMSPPTPTPPRPPRMTQAYLSGNDLENVTLEWNLSPDDGSGLGSVVGYEVYRGSAYSPDGSGYGLLANLTNGTSLFVDNYSGEGDPDNYFYRVCAVDLGNNSACAEDQAAKFTRPLTRDPNLVSIPLIQSNESIETVLQTVAYDRAWSYDFSSREWIWYMTSKAYRRGLWSADHTVGLWVNVTEDCNLTVAGIVPAQTAIHLHEGWNMISFPSFNSSYSVVDLKAETGATRVEGYDSTPPHFLRELGDGEMLQAGYGYWVKVEADTVWTVEVS